MTQMILDRLETLASEVPAYVGQARVICATGAAPLAILEELDCTVLPSDLQFRSAGQHLTLRASGRRLVQVIEASPALPLPQAYIGMPLTHDDTEMRADLARTLTAFTEAGRALQVVVRPLLDQSAMTTSSQSLSVAALTKDLDELGDAASDALPFLDKLSRAARDITDAQIWLDGNRLVKTTGDVAAISGLKTVLTSQLGPLRARQSDLGHTITEPRLSVFADVLGAGASMALVSDAGQMRLLSVPTPNIPALTQQFHQLLEP